MRQIIKFFATGCYVGLMPVAPGTWGTAVGVALFWGIRNLPIVAYVATTITFIILAVWIADRAQAIFNDSDPKPVVIDEIAGLLVTMAFHSPTLWSIVAGFVLFRLFDIIKPPPIRWIERHLSGGWGIVLDDVAAGIYANAALWIVVPMILRLS